MACRCVLLVLLMSGCSGEDETVDRVVPTGGCGPAEWLRDDGVCIPAGIPPDGCGDGFAHDGDRGCEPVLPDEDCPSGLMAVPGETRCREVAPCARGPFGDIPVEPDTEYVDATYKGGASDGTQAAPWTTIQAAIDVASPGAVVAVAAGSYLEDVQVQGKAVRLWGKCPALVELTGTGATLATLFVRSGASGTEVRRLSISGPSSGLLVSGSENVIVDQLRFHDASRAVAAQDDYGPTSFVVRGSLFEGNRDASVYLYGAAATVEATAVRNTVGRGINALDDATTGVRASIAVRSSLLERNSESSVHVSGSDATIETTVVRNTSTDAQGVGGRALSVQDDLSTGERSSIVLERSLLERSHQFGILVLNSDATIEAVVVRDILPDAQGFSGGINAQANPTTGESAHVVITRSLIARTNQFGMQVSGSNATVEAVAVRDIASDAQGFFGRAFQVQVLTETGTAASAILRASLFERSVEAAVGIFGPATAEVEACLLRDTAANPHGAFGDGLVILSYAGPADGSVHATHIERSARAAVSSFGATVGLSSSQLVCQSFDIGAETWQGVPAIVNDRGGVLCGCPEATERCKAHSYALEPPTPPE